MESFNVGLQDKHDSLNNSILKLTITLVSLVCPKSRQTSEMRLVSYFLARSLGGSAVGLKALNGAKQHP